MKKTALLLAFVAIAIGGTTFSRGEGKVAGSSEAERLLDKTLPESAFVEIVENSEGSGRVMEVLSLLASSPEAAGDRFSIILKAVEKYPNSKGAEYLGGNRYLNKDQVNQLAEVVFAKPESKLALNFVTSGSADQVSMDKLVDLIALGKQGEVAEAVAGAKNLSGETQKKLLFIINRNPGSRVAASFAKNPHLKPEIRDALGADAIRNPTGFLAENFAANPGILPAEAKALSAVAAEMPDSSLAGGIGSNRSLPTEVFEELGAVGALNPYSKLGVALAANASLPDDIFDKLISSVDGDEAGEFSQAIAGKGGAGGTEVRAAQLSNKALSNPNLHICAPLIDNPALPVEHLEALQAEAALHPGSKLSQAFVQQIREKRFRGDKRAKGKILEAALMSGDVDTINTR